VLFPPSVLAAHLCVLRQRDVHQALGSWVHDVQKLHDGSPVVRDGDLALQNGRVGNTTDYFSCFFDCQAGRGSDSSADRA